MSRELLNYLPSWLYIALFCGGLTVISITVYFVLRRYFKHIIDSYNNPYLTTLISIISANYAFLLGFVIVTLWQANSQAHKETSKESYELRSIMNNSTGIKPIKEEIRQAVGNYARAIVYDEWPLMRVGKASPKIHHVRQVLFELLSSYTPRNKQEEIFLATIVSKLNMLISKRAARLEFTKSSLSNHLRFILILGAIFLVTLIAILENRNKEVHLFSMTVVSIVIGFNLGLAFCLEYPFSGDMAVKTDAFKIESLGGFFETAERAP